jgi:hypothetical protein
VSSNLRYVAVESDDLPHLVGALEIAAQKYRDFAQSNVEQVRLRDQFVKQAEVCERLRKNIGNVHGY